MSVWFDTNTDLRGYVFNIEVDGIWCTAKFDIPGIVSNGEIFIKKRNCPDLDSFKRISKNIRWFDIAFSYRKKDSFVTLVEGYYPNENENYIIIPNDTSPLFPAALSFIFSDRIEIIDIDNLHTYDLVYCKTIIQSIINIILQKIL